MKMYFKKIMFIFSFILFSTQLLALQLGPIKVFSKQDQNLNAEIKLVLSRGDNLDSLIPSVAGKEVYATQSIERLDLHDDIKMVINKTTNGVILTLTSQHPVTDPFIDLIIQIDSSKGRDYREYTLLLDPLPLDQVVTKKSVKEPEGKKIAEKQKIIPEKKVIKKVETKPEKLIISKGGQTLYQISRINKPSNITVEQMVVAIFQINPNAFFNNNVNGLQKGKKLRLPSDNYFVNLSHIEARKILGEQNVQWKSIHDKTLIKKKSVIKKVDSDKIKLLEKELLQTKLKLKEKIEELQRSNKFKLDNNLSVKDHSKDVEFSLPGNSITSIESDEEVVTFKSSVLNAEEDIINEVVIQDKDDELSVLHMLSLLGFLVLLSGLLIILSRRKKARQASMGNFDNTSESDDDILGTFNSDSSDKIEEPNFKSEQDINKP
ncbi:MAG: FimV/HubP family polar landmark protein [Methylophilaceae bacterium]